MKCPSPPVAASCPRGIGRGVTKQTVTLRRYSVSILPRRRHGLDLEALILGADALCTPGNITLNLKPLMPYHNPAGGMDLDLEALMLGADALCTPGGPPGAAAALVPYAMGAPHPADGGCHLTPPPAKRRRTLGEKAQVWHWRHLCSIEPGLKHARLSGDARWPMLPSMPVQLAGRQYAGWSFVPVPVFGIKVQLRFLYFVRRDRMQVSQSRLQAPRIISLNRKRLH